MATPYSKFRGKSNALLTQGLFFEMTLADKSQVVYTLKDWDHTYDGKVWAMPMYLLGIGLAYNKDLFAQAGVTPPTGDRWTWDEFLAAGRRVVSPMQNIVYADTAGNIGLVAPGRVPIRRKGDGSMHAIRESWWTVTAAAWWRTRASNAS